MKYFVNGCLEDATAAGKTPVNYSGIYRQKLATKLGKSETNEAASFTLCSAPKQNGQKIKDNFWNVLLLRDKNREFNLQNWQQK